MNNIMFFLKIGKKEHLKDLVDGSLYFSNAEHFWGIEENLKIKGQGDILESGSRFFAQTTLMKPHDSGGNYPIKYE